MALIKWIQKVLGQIKDGLRLRRVVRRCGGDEGFTLIEVIVALSCLSIIVLFIFFVYSAIHYILKFW